MGRVPKEPVALQGPIMSLQGHLNHGQWDSLLDRTLGREYVLRTIAKTRDRAVHNIYASSEDGISAEEAAARRKIAGQNVLSLSKPRAWWKILYFSIASPFNVILIVLAVLAVATPGREWANSTVLMVMVFISAALRFNQDYKDGRSAVSLQADLDRQVDVRRPARGSEPQKHSFTQHPTNGTLLVPGDVIALRQGEAVPADCYLLGTNRLLVSQSSLTGESEPEYKTEKPSESADELPIFDMPNLVFMGTHVVSGKAVGLVVGTGDRTLIASVTEELKQRKPTTAFDNGLRNISYLMIVSMVAMMVVVLVLRGKASGNWAQSAEFSLAVAVSIVPEMLPAIINSNLAVGAQRLARRGATARSLSAVQNLGSITVLCSDKTGTLTEGDIALHRAEDCQGEESRHVLGLAFMASHGSENSIDVAISKAACANATETKLRTGNSVLEIPFQFETRLSGAIVRLDGEGQSLLILKGAFEEVLSGCRHIRERGSCHALSQERREAIFTRAHGYNDNGYRVLGVATRAIEDANLKAPGTGGDKAGDMAFDMIFEGLLTFCDPPRAGAATVIKELQGLGVEIKILTGDNARVAMKLCRDLNIVCDGDVEKGIQSITGPGLSELESDKAREDEFHATVQRTTVFAKLTPKQKGQIVRSLQRHHTAVGMLGDGINDCTALRLADVGISVADSSVMAKSCADVVLTRKHNNRESLASIRDAIRIGRTTHANAMKYLHMVISANFGNALSIFIAAIWLPYQPMSSLQILVLNLLYDVSQFALPWDNVDEDYLLSPHARNWRHILWFVLILGPVNTAVDMTTFCLNWFHYGLRTAEDEGRVSLAQTHWLVSGLLTQVLAVYVFRTDRVPFFRSRPSQGLVVVSLAVVALGVALAFALQPPNGFGTTPPDGFFGWMVAVQLAGYLVVLELVKMAYKRVFGRWL